MKSSWHIWDPEVLMVWIAFWAVVLGGLALRAHLADWTDAPQHWRGLRRSAIAIAVITAGMALAVLLKT